MSNPPQPYSHVQCHDVSFEWDLFIDLFHGVRIEARKRGGPCFMPGRPLQRSTVVPVGKVKFAAIRVYECATDANGFGTPGNLAAAVVVTDDEVTFLLPSREPDRTLLISAFLVALASAEADRIGERPFDLDGAL